MKTAQQIERQVVGINWFISNHKKQLDHFLNSDFDIDKAIEYSGKIKELQAEKRILEWVLSES